MVPIYKLTYFNRRALAEPIRFLFAFAKVPFEDVRIEKEDWPALKSDYPLGCLPILEIEGQILSESKAIVRYLGKKFNLAGDNAFESAKCDEMIEVMTDMRGESTKAYFALGQEEQEKHKNQHLLVGEYVHKYLKKWNQIVEYNYFLVGDRFSYADFYIAAYLELFQEAAGEKDLLELYPSLKCHQEYVFNAKGIKEYVNSRPTTPY